MSFLTLTWASLGAFAIVVAVLVAAAVYLAPHFRARRATTALGLLPIGTLAVFAVVYGCVSLASPSAITLAGAHVSYLRDPLLLSLSLLSTVEFSSWPARVGALARLPGDAARRQRRRRRGDHHGADGLQRAQELLDALNIERQG